MCKLERRGACGNYITSRDEARSTVHHVQMNCGSWLCPNCAQSIKKPETRDHLVEIATKNHDNLHYSTCDRRQWKAIHRRIQRSKNDFFRLTIGDVCHIFTTAPIGNQLPHNQAVRLICRLIDLIPLQKRPFSSSRGWKKPARKKRGLTKIGISRVHPLAMCAACKKNGLNFKSIGGALHIKLTAAVEAKALLLDARRLTRITSSGVNSPKFPESEDLRYGNSVIDYGLTAEVTKHLTT